MENQPKTPLSKGKATSARQQPMKINTQALKVHRNAENHEAINMKPGQTFRITETHKANR